MGVAVLVLLVFAAAAAPELCPDALAIGAHPPDLCVAIAAYLALRGSGYGAVKWGIALGAAKDCLSLDPLGTHAFVVGAVALLLSRNRSGQMPVKGVTRAVAVGGAALFAHALYVLRMLPVSPGPLSLSALLDGAPIALWTAVACAPLFALLDRTGALDDVAGRPRGLPA